MPEGLKEIAGRKARRCDYLVIMRMGDPKDPELQRKRAELRDAHLARASGYRERGHLIIGGALMPIAASRPARSRSRASNSRKELDAWLQDDPWTDRRGLHRLRGSFPLPDRGSFTRRSKGRSSGPASVPRQLRALALVHHLVPQHADLRHLDLDHVAGLEPFRRVVVAAGAGRRAGPDQVAGLAASRTSRCN